MVDYTWVVNLLREVEAFAAGGKHRALSNSVAIACGALVSDIEDNAQIRSEARLWIENATAGHGLLSPATGKNTIEAAQVAVQTGTLSRTHQLLR